MSLSWIQKKPCVTTSLASAARSFFAVTSANCLRKATKAASSYGTGGLAATGVYGFIGGGRGGFAGRNRGLCWVFGPKGAGANVAAATKGQVQAGGHTDT